MKEIQYIVLWFLPTSTPQPPTNKLLNTTLLYFSDGLLLVIPQINIICTFCMFLKLFRLILNNFGWLIEFEFIFIHKETSPLAVKYCKLFGLDSAHTGRDLYRATPAVTRYFGFCGLIWRSSHVALYGNDTVLTRLPEGKVKKVKASIPHKVDRAFFPYLMPPLKWDIFKR